MLPANQGLETGDAPVFERDDGLVRSEEHTSELQSQSNLVCRLLLEKKKILALHRCRLCTRVFDRLPLAFNPMTTQQFLNSAWTWHTTPLALSVVALVASAGTMCMTRRLRVS